MERSIAAFERRMAAFDLPFDIVMLGMGSNLLKYHPTAATLPTRRKRKFGCGAGNIA